MRITAAVLRQADGDSRLEDVELAAAPGATAPALVPDVEVSDTHGAGGMFAATATLGLTNAELT